MCGQADPHLRGGHRGSGGARLGSGLIPLCCSLRVAVHQALTGPSEAVLSQRVSWGRLEGPVMGCDLCAREGREASPSLRRTVHPASSLAVWGVPSLSRSRFRPLSYGVSDWPWASLWPMSGLLWAGPGSVACGLDPAEPASRPGRCPSPSGRHSGPSFSSCQDPLLLGVGVRVGAGLTTSGRAWAQEAPSWSPSLRRAGPRSFCERRLSLWP